MDTIINSKDHASKLSKNIVAYKRDGEDETIVIRTFYEHTKFNAFGVASQDEIIHMFNLLLALATTNRVYISSNMKYSSQAFLSLMDKIMKEKEGDLENYLLEIIENQNAEKYVVWNDVKVKYFLINNL